MKNCMIWGGMGDGSVETSLLCFCMRRGHARIQEFLPGGGVQARLPENSSDNFFSPQLYRGCPVVISNKTIIFNIFQGGGGVQMLISIETNITYDFPGGGPDPLPPSGSAHGETVRVHMPILSLRCLQMRQVHG